MSGNSGLGHQGVHNMTQAVKLVATATVSGEIELICADGYTAQEVADLLTSGRAFISDKDVLLPAPAPAEGMSHIAKVVRQKVDHQPLVWSVSK